MLRLFTVFLAILIFNVSICGQSKRDHTWILGYPTLVPGQPNTDRYGGMFMLFQDGTYTLENFDIFAGPISAVANDESGSLLFYTNGCSIYNSYHEVMENGDEINIGSVDYDLACDERTGILYIRSGNIALPVPDNPNDYQLFHLKLISTSDTSLLFDQLLITRVSMESEGGKVVEKNQPVVTDSLHDAIAAVRHGNGRDWWIITPRGTNRQFWKILFTPEGIESKHLQAFPPPYPPYTVKYFVSVDTPPFTQLYVPDEYGFESWGGQAAFSPDGSKYCRIIKAGVVEIYDFDRCSGDLELRRVFTVPPYINYPQIPLVACGLAISPNSRFLYFNNNEALYQFDLCEENIDSGDYVLIEEWDGYFEDSSFATNFFQMRNAPDNKIYIASSVTTHSLHVIHEPNKAGKACLFEQRGVVLPRWTSWIINDFPNFRLYDLAGSPCDTLGIDDPNPPEPPILFKELKLFPNPASEVVKIFVPQCESIRIQIWNMAGQLIGDVPVIPGMEAYPLNISNWPSGTYTVASYIDAQNPTMQKLIVVH